MKHLKTQKQLNEGQENLNISDVRGSVPLSVVEKHISEYISNLEDFKNNLYEERKTRAGLNPIILKKIELIEKIENELNDLINNIFEDDEVFF